MIPSPSSPWGQASGLLSPLMHYRDQTLYLEGDVPLADVAKRHGTPCYIYSRATILDKFQGLQKKPSTPSPTKSATR